MLGRVDAEWAHILFDTSATMCLALATVMQRCVCASPSHPRCPVSTCYCAASRNRMKPRSTRSVDILERDVLLTAIPTLGLNEGQCAVQGKVTQGGVPKSFPLEKKHCKEHGLLSCNKKANCMRTQAPAKLLED